MISATGLGSGLDISGLVSQLVAAERAGSDLQLNRESTKLNARISAFGSLKGSISSFQGSLATLKTLSNFDKKVITSSDTKVISATASNSAVLNDYSIDVTQLAASHSLASTAFADSTTTAIGTGTITFRFGTTDYDSGTDTYNSFTLNPDSSSATITIDSTNNTLEGIMNEINAGNFGVKASIVNDGTGYRLLMTSEETGLVNSMEVTVDDDDLNDTDTSGLSNLAFNSAATNMEQSAAAKNSNFTINGLAMSHAGNVVSEAIPGVTLTLKQLTTETINLSVTQDSAVLEAGVNTFISGYNQFINIVNSLTGYNVDSKVAGTLLGDFTVRSIKSQIGDIVYNPIEGLTGDFTSMSEIGITTGDDGKLVFDKVKFNEALQSNPEDVKKIFSAIGVPTDADIAFKNSSSATVTGSYAVNISALATAGTLTGNGVLPDFSMGGTVTIDANNDNLTVEVDGVNAGEITITNGVYSAGEDLAAEIQSRINGTTAMRDAGKTVSVTYDSGTNSFTITSGTLGNASAVNILAVDTNTATDLGFSVVNGTDGTDVAGTIDGVAGTGAGSLLTAADGTDAEGLSLTVGGTTTGSRGTVDFTRGLASQLDLLFNQILDAEGTLESRIDSIKDRQTAVEDRRAELELRWKSVEERYLNQFNALDGLLAGLQFTSDSLSQQLANLPGPYKLRSTS